jgi:hypothetical protein
VQPSRIAPVAGMLPSLKLGRRRFIGSDGIDAIDKLSHHS